jgi:hypothetical protein
MSETTAQTPEPGRPARSRRTAPAVPARPDSRYPHRFTLTISTEQKRALLLAKADDGIDGTYRLRALLDLWTRDQRLRSRVDKLALSESQQDRHDRGQHRA